MIPRLQRKHSLTLAVLLLALGAVPRPAVATNCWFDATAGSVTINVFLEDGTVCLDCSEIPTLVIHENGIGNMDIQFTNKKDGTCTATSGTADDYFNVSSIFAGVENCPKGSPNYGWWVRNTATGQSISIYHRVGDEASSYLDAQGYIGSGDAGNPPLFLTSGTYEVIRSYQNCGDDSSDPSIVPDSAELVIPIEVVVEGEVPPVRTIIFDDAVGDRYSAGSLFGFLVGAQNESGLCVDESTITVQESQRYICSPDGIVPGIEPYATVDTDSCSIEEMEWQSFSGSDGFGFWTTLGTSPVVGGGFDPVTGASLSSEDVRENLPSSGSLIVRRRDERSSGEFTYTNELTITIAGNLTPFVTPTTQEVCDSGSLEELSADYGGAPIGDVRYQWQARPISAGAEYSDIPGANDPTFTPPTRTREYRVQLWQATGLANVARNGIASMSSQWDAEHGAEKAIDGIRDGDFHHDSIAHSGAGEPSPSWSVDLDQSYRLDSITLWNRTDCCEERLTNVRVSVLDDAGIEVFGEDWLDDAEEVVLLDFDLPEGTWGRTVQVAFLGEATSDRYLQLAEVEIFGYVECGPYSSDPATVTITSGARVYYPDADGDGYPDKSGESRLLCELEDGWVPASREEDCNDGSALIHPGRRWYFDEDGDGLLPRDAVFVEQCERPTPFANWIALRTDRPFDCSDTDPTVGGGSVWWKDADRDGYTTGESVRDCVPPPGYRSQDDILGPGDCDDRDPKEHPGSLWFVDADGDRHGVGPAVSSCTRPEGHFLADELTTTQDCDDDDAAYSTTQAWYRDADEDGYPAADAEGDDPDFVLSCQPRAGYVKTASELVGEDPDCDDADPERHPGQRWYPDRDGDGLGDALSAPIVACEPPGADFASNHRDCDDDDDDPERCVAGPGAGSALRLGPADVGAGLVRADHPALRAFGRADFVVEAWIRTGSLAPQAILTRGSPCGDADAWALYLAAGGTAEGVVLGSRGQRIEVSGSSVIADDEWHHVLLRRIDDEISLWVDAVREDAEESNVFAVGGTEAVVVGNDGPAEGGDCLPGFVGLIDNVRIWSGDDLATRAGRALHHLVPGDTDGLVAHWSFDRTTTGGVGDAETFVDDSAQGFPLLLGAGRLAVSTAPVGVGVVETTVFVDQGNPVPDIAQPSAGVVITEAQPDGPTLLVLTTRLDVSPAGEVTPVVAPFGETYWILELLGPTTSVAGDLWLTFPSDAITAAMQATPGDVVLWSRPANSDGEWMMVATATSASAADDRVRFDGVTLSRSQLAVTYEGAQAPTLVASPRSLVIATIPIGETAEGSVRLENAGSSSLDIHSITLEAAAGSGLELLGPTGPLRLDPRGTRDVEIRFAPTTPGPRSGALVIASSDTVLPELRISVTARATDPGTLEPVLFVDANSLDFGVVELGGDAETRTLSLRNDGTADLAISAISIENDAAAAFSIEQNAGPTTLAPGGAASVTIAFLPITAGAHTASLRIESDDPEAGVVDVALSGEGSGPSGVVFRRGDSDGNGNVELTDAIATLGFLFLGRAAPGCLDAADTDDSGRLDLTDAIGILGFLFLGAVAPADPGPSNCGADPSAGGSLGCESYRSCGG